MKAWVWWAAGAAGAAGVVATVFGLKGAGLLPGGGGEGSLFDSLPFISRSPQDLLNAVARVDPEHNPTLQNGYLGQPNWCNRFVHLVCEDLGVPLLWGQYGTRADDQIAYLDAGNDGWFPASSQQVAQDFACQGYVVLATYYSFLGSGHMALVLPFTGTMMIAQAGKSCFNRGTLAAGFGGIKPVFYIHS